jgi:methionyl-tRNA formyltransferase
MNVVFCGSGEFAIPSLRAILGSRHDVPLVVTQPARHAGRGGRRRPTPVSVWAGEHGLNLLECPDANTGEAMETLRRAAPDAICVVDFGQYLRKPLRELPPTACFNLHASLLPALRGAAPINWALIRGHRVTGVTTFVVTSEMDAGPIFFQHDTPVDPDEDAPALKARLSEIGAGLVCQTLGVLEAGWAEPLEQDPSAVTAAPRLTKADGHIDFTAPARRVHDLVRGTVPWPGAKARFVGSGAGPVEVTIGRSAVVDDTASPASPPGTIDASGRVACGEGVVEFPRIKPAGKREIAWRDFVNGYHVKQGDRFEALDET